MKNEPLLLANWCIALKSRKIMMICSSFYAEQHHRYVQLKIHIRDIVSVYKLEYWHRRQLYWITIRKHCINQIHFSHTTSVWIKISNLHLDACSVDTQKKHRKSEAQFYFKSENCVVELYTVHFYTTHPIRFSLVFVVLLTRTLSSLIPIVIAMRPLSMQTKIKWNNLVFLMLICYLAADGLIHHANTNALAHIHKLLSTPWYNVYRAFDIDAVGETRAQPSSISAHVIKWFMHSFWNVEHSCPCTK